MAGTHFKGPIFVAGVEVIDDAGNIDAPVTTTDLTTTGNTTLGNATTDTLTVNGNATLTGTAAGNSVDVVGAAITTGKVLDASDLDAFTTGKGIHLDATGITQTDGMLVHLDSASTALTSTGRILLSDHTGNATVSGVLNEFKTAAADETVLAKLNATAALTGVVLDASAPALQTGKVIDISDLDAITTGKAIHVDATGVTHTSGVLVHLDSAGTAITGAGRIFLSDHTGATTTSGILNEFKSAANDESVILQVTASDINALGTALEVSTATTTGKGLDVTANALTTGVGLGVTSTAATTQLTGAGRLFKVDHTGNASGSGIVAEIASAAADETVIAQVKASAALAAGKALNVSGASVTTGTLLSVEDGDALTTGSLAKFKSNSADATARNLVSIINDNASAAGSCPLYIQQDAVTSTNFLKVLTLGSFSIWTSNETTPNGNLTGTKGDICLNGSATGQAFWCTGTTNWTALA